MSSDKTHNEITEAIIGAAIKVHKALGPGLLESAYEACIVYELSKQGFKVEQQKPLKVKYEEVLLDCAYRLDVVVENKVILELKSVGKVMPVHKAQILSYLKHSGLQVGLLVNFNETMLKRGIERVVNNYQGN
jgi:GxxExxY protein